MNAIVAVDENWAIGKDGKLLADLPGDKAYFKEKTIGKRIVIGRKTLESFPDGKPLPDRENIVLTHNRNYQARGCTVINTFMEFTLYASKFDQDVFVCGGAEIYKLLVPVCDNIYVTHIMHKFDDADVYFPDLTEDERLVETWRSDVKEENGFKYYFAKYERQERDEPDFGPIVSSKEPKEVDPESEEAALELFFNHM